MSNGPIRPRDSDVQQDHTIHRLNLAINDGLIRGIVCGPYDMTRDYTEDDMAKMREAGRQAAIAQEAFIMEALDQIPLNSEPIKQQSPQYAEKNKHGSNRKARRAKAAEERKAKKLFAKIKKAHK